MTVARRLFLSALPAAGLGLAAAADPSSYFSDTPASSSTDPYESWLSSLPAPYAGSAFLPSDDGSDGAAVFWRVDAEAKAADFAVAVPTEGWVGLGLSSAGGMIGSDVALFESSSPDVLIDSHVLASYVKPIPDDCPDWELKSATVEDGWIFLEIRRLLDTNDPQDVKLVDDSNVWAAPTRLIAAWGDGDAVAYHGKSKGRASVRLFVEDFDPKTLEVDLEAKSDGHFEVREENYPIPEWETEYRVVCRTAEDLGITKEGGVSMIGAIPIITEENRAHLHHFTVYVAPSCDEDTFPRSMIYIWAPGSDGLGLPENVGFPMFHSENSQAIRVEIHYDNPDGVKGKIDSSGVRFFYTDERQEQDAGILEMGDPFLSLEGERIADGLTKYEFTCPGTCSQNVGGGPVTVINEILHMHQTGQRMTNEIIRGGEVVHFASSEVYDFEAQGGFQVPQADYQLLPGDGIRTTCYYKDGGRFGLDSDEEMCITYIMYYPAKEKFGYPWMCPYDAWFFEFLGEIGCDPELEFSSLDGEDGLGRLFGASEECAVDSLLPSPTAAPVTGQPTASTRPSIGLEQCDVCPGGITVDPEYIVPQTGGQTCEAALGWTKASALEGGDSCDQAKSLLGPLCCPTLAANPCPLCLGGVGDGLGPIPVPGTDGSTCSELVEFATFLEEDVDFCSQIQQAEILCCPGGGGAAPETCSFCEGGVTNDPDAEIPGAPNGETCGEVNELAASLAADSEFCPEVQLAEIFCCPSTTGTCSFCEGGVTNDPDAEIPGAPNGETCGEVNELAASLAADSEFCPEVQLAQIFCCPSTVETESEGNATEVPKGTDDTTESPTPSPTASPQAQIAETPAEPEGNATEVPEGTDSEGTDDTSAGVAIYDMKHYLKLFILPFVYMLKELQ